MDERLDKQPGSERMIPSLAGAYKGMFDIGAAVNAHTIDSSKELLKAHYNSLTAENDMKFERIHPEPGVYTYDIADKLVDFAINNGMRMRGHTLVWHNQTPDWVFESKAGGGHSGIIRPADRHELLHTMKEHIDTVVGRYKGKVYSWDVVNEVIADEADLWLRGSRWLNIIGEDFIAKAFEYAHAADPDAVLFYNDYNECHPDKRDKIIRLLKALKERDVPIHGMGMQGHWNLTGPSEEEIREAIEQYAALDLQIQITELDISMFQFDDRRTDLKEPTAEMLELQAERYDKVFRLLREYKDVITSVTFWGVADDYTWLHDFPVRGRRNWPFVFDEKHEPKSSFWKMTSFADYNKKSRS